MKRLIAIVLFALAAGAAAEPLSSPNAFGISPSDAGEAMRYRRCLKADLDTESRLAACRQLVKDKGYSSYPGIVLGEIYLEQSDPQAALDLYNRMVTVDRDQTGYDLRGAYSAATGDYDAAMTDAQAAFTTGEAEEYALAGRCFIRAVANRELEAGLADCDAAVAKSPRDSGILEARAFILYRMGRMADAATAYTAALERDRRSPSALYMRGLAERSGGDSASGDKDVAAAVAIDPHIVALFAFYGVKAG